MPLLFEIKDEIDWKTLAPGRTDLRKILRTTGTALATRLRQRFVAKGKLIDKVNRFSRQTRASAENAAKTRAALKERIGRETLTKYRSTGQLQRSLKARLRRSEDTVVIGFRGIRKDADTHKKRPPMSNFSIAAFHSAKGNDMLGLTEADNAWFIAEVESKILALVQKETADLGGAEDE